MLARLALDDEEVERLTHELGAILEHAADVAALDLDGVPPTAHPLPLVNVLRPDDVAPEPRRATRCSRPRPPTEDGRFRVPRILDETLSTAIEIADDVRSGRHRAREVVDEHLAVIDAREPELHAFNSRARRTRRGRLPTRSTPRWPVATIRGRWPACPSW